MHLLEELRARGIRLAPVNNGRNLKVEPRDKLTPELIEAIKRNKQVLLRLLTMPRTHQNKPQPTYGYTYAQLCRMLVDLLKAHGGFLLVKSSVLGGEVIAFSLPQYINKLTQQGYVCYLPSELAHLLLKQPTPQALKAAHEVKKVFEGAQILH